MLDDARLGTATGMEQVAFGPLPGTWADVARVQVRDAEGNRIAYSARGEYSLGEIPRFFVGFTVPPTRP